MSFPSSPVNGQVAVVNSVTYTYDSSSQTWTRAGLNSSKITSGTAPPASPSIGDLWYDTNTNAVYRWTFDGASTWWIDTTGGSDNFFSSANVLTISSNVASTSATTGALVVYGGVGVTGNLFVGNINVFNKNMITSLIFGS